MQIIGCKLKSQREIQRIQARANTQTGAAAVQMNLPTFRTSANILSDEQVEEKNKSCGAGCPTLCVSNKLFPFFFSQQTCEAKEASPLICLPNNHFQSVGTLPRVHSLAPCLFTAQAAAGTRKVTRACAQAARSDDQRWLSRAIRSV